MEVGISQVVERIDRLGSGALGMLSERECVRRFVEFMDRLRTLLEQLEDVYNEEELPAGVGTALRGMETDLEQGEKSVSSYTPKSQFFVFTHCEALNRTMEDLTYGLGKWISLAGILDNRDLKRKVDELSLDMQRAKYQVTEAEQRALEALEKHERQDTVVAGSLWRDIVRLIGIEPQVNSAALQEQVRLLRKEIRDLKKDSELQKMQNILKLFEHVMEEPQLIRMYSFKETIEEEPVPLFDSFLCPLTKKIMKDPVMIQSELTYERSAIEKWFTTCNEERRPLTCPVTRTVLRSSEVKNNVMLRQTIEEWSQRNSKIRIQHAMEQLVGATSLEVVEEALDNVLKVAEDGPLTPYKLYKSRFTSLLLDLWRRKVPEGSQVRTKALIILQKIAADDVDSQEALIEAGVLKTAVRALHSNQVSETESALRLLLVISKEAEHCKLIGKEKGAIIHLLGIASNSDGNSALSVLAERTLQNLGQVESNVWEMAESGRLEPLLAHFQNGTEENRVEIAKYFGERLYVASQKEHVARRAGLLLVQMLSGSSRSKEASLRALLNLSSLQENVPVLVKAGVLIPVVDIVFSVPTSSNSLHGVLKEESATTLANIVSVPGSWEAAKVDEHGNSMQSEHFVHGILERLSVGPNWNSILLKILVGVASSPQATESIAKHVVNGSGMRILLVLARENGEERKNVLNLLQVLSSKAGKEVGQALIEMNYLVRLKEVMKGRYAEESLYAAATLANLSLSDTEVVSILGLDTMSWCLRTLEELKAGQHGSARVTTAMMENVLGVLLQFARSWNRDVLEAMKQNKVMQRFKEFLQLHQAAIKQRAAAGLGLLSARGLQAVKEPCNTSKQEGGFGLLCCLAGPSVRSSELCPLHNMKCNVNDSFCLHEANAVGLLVELLEEEDDIKVQTTVVDALSTLVMDNSRVEGGVRELDESRGVEVVVRWFQRLRPSSSSEAQEKGVFLVERILRVEQHAARWSLDQGLIKALVEVFKHGSGTAKRNAEAALAHTHMLAVVSGGTGGYSNISKGKR